MKQLVYWIISWALLISISGKALAQSGFYGSETRKFDHFYNLVNNYYVDTINHDELMEAAIKGVLEKLDPHSTYIPKEEVEASTQALKGNFEGIGIQFRIMKDTIWVVATIPGGPSEKVGLRAGDRIIKVDGEDVAGIGITNEGVRERLMGDKDTQVEVVVKRPRVNEALEFTIVRDKIPIFSLDASYMLNKETGYIKLNRFSATTVDEFQEAMLDLKTHGLKNLVLDLRGNGGGYLSAAKELADHFLQDARMIVYTKGINNPRRNYRASSMGLFEQGPLIVLVDEGSASASEIVSGAVQDWDRGLIIGRRTFGKGLVQQPFRLSDGSRIRLTVARYYTPTGRLIQKPYDNGVKEYRKEILERYEHGEFISTDSIDFPDSLKYYTKENKRLVYGGGGIMPDIFIPFDTTEYSDYHRDIVSKGVMSNYIIEYIDENRDYLLQEYQDFESFKKEFTVSDAMLDSLVAAANGEEIEWVEEEFERSQDYIRLQLKALIARDIWNTSEYYQIMNTRDKALEKALEILSRNNITYQQAIDGELIIKD